jgi:hypothetical protein
MPVYHIPSLTAVLVQAPIHPTVAFDRGLKDYLAGAQVHRGVCRAPESRSRHPLYLAELVGMPQDDRFLLSADARTFLRPAIRGIDRREEPRGPMLGPEGHFLKILGKVLPVNGSAPSKQPDRNDGYRLGLFDGTGIVLAFERGVPRLWRDLHGGLHPFDSELYYPGRAPADALIASGFSSLSRAEAYEMITDSAVRFLR